MTEVLSVHFKKTPVYFDCEVPNKWSAITNFKILRELDRGYDDVKDSLVSKCNACARASINMLHGSLELSDFETHVLHVQ